MADASSADSYFERFQLYFARPIAEKAGAPLSDGVEIEINIQPPSSTPVETFTYTRVSRQNLIKSGPPLVPQLRFFITPDAAETILNDPSESIPRIGISIVRYFISPDSNRRVEIHLKTSLMDLFMKGYFGILTAGGTEFMSYLASEGFSSMGKIKEALSNLRK